MATAAFIISIVMGLAAIAAVLLSRRSNNIAEEAKEIAKDALEFEKSIHAEDQLRSARVEIDGGPWHNGYDQMFVKVTNTGNTDMYLGALVFEADGEIVEADYLFDEFPNEGHLAPRAASSQRVFLHLLAEAVKKIGKAGAVSITCYVIDTEDRKWPCVGPVPFDVDNDYYLHSSVSEPIYGIEEGDF